MSWLSRFMLANWSHILGALILLIALVFGMQIGASRVQKAWDAEKLKIALTQARQEQRVADVQLTQSQITQDISNDRQLDSSAGGVCNITTAGGRDMPAVSEASERAAPTRSDPLLAPQGDAGVVSCEQLSKDAAQTTLMLMEVQRWYREQSAIEP